MQPITTPEASAEPPRPRFPDEVRRHELAAELEQHIEALNEYCAQEPQPERAFQINEFIAAVGQYDQATEELLESYRQALEYAQRPVAEPVPTLEEAILSQLSPAELLAYREADPVYHLGFVRGQRKGTADTERQYERLVSLYAQHAVIVPPLTYQPSPLIVRVKRFLATLLMSGPRLPLATRTLLFNQTPNPLRPDAKP